MVVGNSGASLKILALERQQQDDQSSRPASATKQAGGQPGVHEILLEQNKIDAKVQ